MPEGIQGFVKGRQKTGGRTKGGPARKATKFVDQLSDSGFNYVKELASVLKDMKELRNNAPDPVKAAELKFFYGELKSLLPFMAPKLREKEVEVVEPTDPGVSESTLSTEDLLKAINGPEEKIRPRASNPNPVGAGNIELHVPPGPEVNLQDMVGEQEED